MMSSNHVYDLLNARIIEIDWFAFGEWYSKDEVSAREIFMKSDFGTRSIGYHDHQALK